MVSKVHGLLVLYPVCTNKSRIQEQIQMTLNTYKDPIHTSTIYVSVDYISTKTYLAAYKILN